MGLLDNISGALKGAVGQIVAAEAPGLISAVLAKTNLVDLQGLVTKLQQGGLNEQVQSWLGNGPGHPRADSSCSRQSAGAAIGPTLRRPGRCRAEALGRASAGNRRSGEP